jgi:hypothetical protein
MVLERFASLLASPLVVCEFGVLNLVRHFAPPLRKNERCQPNHLGLSRERHHTLGDRNGFAINSWRTQDVQFLGAPNAWRRRTVTRCAVPTLASCAPLSGQAPTRRSKIKRVFAQFAEYLANMT